MYIREETTVPGLSQWIIIFFIVPVNTPITNRTRMFQTS